MGLMLQPYWAPGVRHPGLDAKGAIIGFGDVHTRAHVYRAILEGLAYALRDGGERIANKTGTALTELRVSGGGSQSDAAMQLTADIFCLPASRPHTYETSGLGAAIVSAVALGIHADFAAAVRAMTRTAPAPSSRSPPTQRCTKTSTSRSIAACTAGWRRSTRGFAGSPAIQRRIEAMALHRPRLREDSVTMAR